MARRTASEDCRRDDRGAVLVLALIFMTIGSVLVISLARLATTNLVDTNSLLTTRVTEYATDSAVQAAIQQARYHGACQDFPTTGSVQVEPGEYVYVHCVAISSSLIAAQATTGSFQLSSPSGSFPTSSDYWLSNQPVTLASGSTLKDTAGNALTVISTTSTTATLSGKASTSGTVYVGAPGVRLYDFTGCAGGPSLSSCPNPQLTAAVLFDDVSTSTSFCASLSPAQTEPCAALGSSVSILRWTVNDANS